MASFSSLLLPLFFLFLLFTSAAGASDSAVLLHVIADLGGGGGGGDGNPCRSPGVSCERRVLIHLRAVRISLPARGLGGSLSPSIGRLVALRELSLAGNRLSGGLPAEISGCRELELLDLRGNALSGRVPREISSLVSLRVLDLSGNQFGGDLGFLMSFPNLENLSLADNLFSGRIPLSISSFRNLRSLDLSGNPALRGPFPPLHSAAAAASNSNSLRRSLLPKRYVLAENSTTGNRNNSTTRPRPRLSDGAAPAPAPSPTAPPVNRRHNNKRRLRNWILGFVVGSLSGVASGMLLSVLFRLLMNCIRGRYRNPSGPAIFSPMIKKAEHLAFLEKDDGVASLELIGRGGCGEVYRAVLPGTDPPRTVAVKKITKIRLDNASELSEEDSRLLDKRMRQLRTEILTVGHIRHRNLLPLLAHVPRHDCHYLVYEYMKNGSLQDWLKGAAEGTRVFDWPARHRVAVGIATGLEYLHTQHSPRIIHRDLKPGNILIDDNMEARIADFGLAKAVPDADTHMTTSNVAGTVGYIAPEYHQLLKFTDKCDIYSFGVILAVLVLGKQPSDDFFQTTDEMSLVKWLRNVMRAASAAADGGGGGVAEELAVAVDPKLVGTGCDEQMLLMLKIACFCTMDDPKERPNSKDVRIMLAQIKN